MTITAPRRVDVAQARLVQYLTQECKQGDQLASEAELSEWLGVSRASVREVLAGLAQMGLVDRQWGVGTFVAGGAQTMVAQLEEFAPLMDIIRRQGHSPSVVLDGAVHVAGPSPAHDAMNRTETEPLWKVSRVYLVDDTPGIYVQDYLPTVIHGKEFAPALVVDDLLPILETHYGTIASHAHTILAPAVPQRRIAEALGLRRARPMLLIRQTAYDQMDGQPIMYTESYSRPDVFSYSIVRRRNGARLRV
ncbi:MAG: GntR family transcriptional regulator [Candidatus Dormibacteria bacterium]